jgi:hypothetical protein
MRKQKEITKLDNILQEDKDKSCEESAVFPARPAAHDYFRIALNEVIRANFKENTSCFGGLVGRVEYHEYDYRFYVEIKRSPYSVYDSMKDAIDFPKWIDNIGATFATIVWLDRGGSVTDFIKSIELRLKHLEQAGSLFNQAIIRESTEDAVFKEDK